MTLTAPPNEVPKILVVSGDSFSDQLIEYALKMAQRLDFEIITLNVNETIVSLDQAEQERARAAFYETAREATRLFTERGEAWNVSVTSVIDINEAQKAIKALEKQEPGIRYILSEPDPKRKKGANRQSPNPAFNLVTSG